MVTSGKEVIFIKNSNDVLFANSIGKALNESYNKKNIKFVVVKNRPSALSHEAIVFNSRGIPVVYIEDESEYNKARDLAKKSKQNNVVMLDQQLGSIIETQSDITKAKELTKEGNYSYPISRGFFKKNIDSESKENFINFLKKQKPADPILIQNFKQNPTQTLKNIINKLKEANTKNDFNTQSELILQILKYSAEVVMKADPSKQFLQPERMQLIKIHNELTELLGLVNNIGISRNEQLLYIENINSLLLNMQTEGNVNSGSLANILYKVGSFQRAKKSNPNQSNAKAEIKAIGNIVAITPEIAKHFNDLVDKENDNQKIINNIVEMEKGKILDDYINIYLPSCDTIEEIKDDKNIQFQKEFQTKIKNFENSINGFAGKEYKLLQEELVTLTQEFMKVGMISEKGISQFLFTSNSSQLLDIWDRCIKKFKDNTDCNEGAYLDFVIKLKNEFATNFLNQLNESNMTDSVKMKSKYIVFLRNFVKDCYVWTEDGVSKFLKEKNFDFILEEVEALIKLRSSGSLTTLREEYKNSKSKTDLIDGFKKYINTLIDNSAVKDLAPIQNNKFKNNPNKYYYQGMGLSKGFDVQKMLPGVTGNVANARRQAEHAIKTVEDLFTFIHQLSNEGITSILRKYAVKENILPHQLVELMNDDPDFKKPINFLITNNTLELKFTHVLRNHSAATSIFFDKKTKKWKIVFCINGPGWIQSHNYSYAIISLDKIAFENGLAKNSYIYPARGVFEVEFDSNDIAKSKDIFDEILSICKDYRGVVCGEKYNKVQFSS